MSFQIDLKKDLRRIRERIDKEKNAAKKSKLIKAYKEVLKTLEA